jgi:hypothetical protein
MLLLGCTIVAWNIGIVKSPMYNIQSNLRRQEQRVPYAEYLGAGLRALPLIPLIPPKMLNRSFFSTSMLRFLLCRLLTLPVSVAAAAPPSLLADPDFAERGEGATSAIDSLSFSMVLSSDRPKNCLRFDFSFGAASL